MTPGRSGMEKQTDILAFLGQVVQENTNAYRSDFVYDTATLTKAIWETGMEDRIFYWMSRPAGTWCVKEREVFLRGTSAHSIWTHYADAPERIRAYRIIRGLSPPSCRITAASAASTTSRTARRS